MKLFTFKFLFVYISVFLSFTGLLSSQNNQAYCGTKFSSKQIEYLNSLKSQLLPLEQTFLSKKSSKIDVPTKIVNSIPVKVHIVRFSDGSGGLSVSEINNTLNNLNQQFYDALIEFFICDDINYIDNDALCHYKKGDEASLIESNNVSGLINIYFTEFLENDSNKEICGYSNNKRSNDYIVIKNNCATNNSSLAHEMGHFFSLLHTHGSDNEILTTELVDGSNCDTDGDGICDTPADPKLSSDNINNFCEYTGTNTDALGNLFNPDTGNIMSYSRKACRSHFSEQQLARIYAFYVTQKSYFSCPSFNADFNVDVSQTCGESLTVNFNSGCSGISNWQWDIDSDGVIDYTSQNPTHTFDSGIYDVSLTVTNNSKAISKRYSNFIKVDVLTEALFDESFDDFEIAGDNGWIVNDISNSGYNWLINHGETSTENTGPINDNTNQEVLGKYIYAESSGASAGDVTEFISPCIDVVYENSEIEFAYHMFGEHIGELHVDIKTESGYILDVIEPLIGNQQINQNDSFLTKNINLSSYHGETINIRFRAIRGNGYKGDIAIDDVFLKTIITPISDEVVKLYPNPVKNNLLYIKTNSPDDSHLTYKISNLVGQKFISGIISRQPINTSSLSSGTYLLIITGEKTNIVRRFIK